jgi:hypothetical protein
MQGNDLEKIAKNFDKMTKSEKLELNLKKRFKYKKNDF